MGTIDMLCLGTLILAGLIYGIWGTVTRNTHRAGKDHVGKDVLVPGWQIALIFALFAMIFVYALLNLK